MTGPGKPGRSRSSPTAGWESMTVRVRPEIRARLEEAAAERVLGVALIVDRLLADGLDRLVPLEELMARPPTGEAVEMRAAQVTEANATARAIRAHGEPEHRVVDALPDATKILANRGLPPGWVWAVYREHNPTDLAAPRHLAAGGEHLTRCGMPDWRPLEGLEGAGAPCGQCVKSGAVWWEGR